MIYLNTIYGIVQLNNVWYVPSFRNTRLLSIWELNNTGTTVTFRNGVATAYSDSTNKELFRATGRNGLYLLDSGKETAYSSRTKVWGNIQSISEPHLKHRLNPSYPGFQISDPRSQISDPGSEISDPRKSKNRRTSETSEEEEEWTILHQRLGHASYKNIDILLNGNSTSLQKPRNIRKILKGEKKCECCLAGKMKESFHKKTDSRIGTKARRLHADLSGRKPLSCRDYRYFLVVIDDASRRCWLRLLKTKTTAEVFPHLVQIRKIVERETKEKCVYVRADNGSGEFGATFQDSLAKDGVQFEPSPPFKHSLNGVIERAIGIITEIARTIMYQAKMPY